MTFTAAPTTQLAAPPPPWRARWNISLFHYRNHGSDFGRVLAGVQVPDAALVEFRQHLAELAYPWWDETGNPAYRMFLGGG